MEESTIILYTEIFDLKSELTEYKKLCRNKSMKFKYYSEWNTYVKNKLSVFETTTQLNNYKRYLIERKRRSHNYISIYRVMVPVLITFIFMIPQIMEHIITAEIILLTYMFLITKDDFKENREYCFYEDLIEIIEKMEKDFDNKGS